LKAESRFQRQAGRRRWWLDRWVAKRIERPEVLERMAMHSLVHPIRHGARVKLPRTDPEHHLLFED
jgi:hypothetical protein